MIYFHILILFAGIIEKKKIKWIVSECNKHKHTVNSFNLNALLS